MKKKYFEEFINNNIKIRENLFLDTFKSIEKDRISSLILYPTKKKIKKTDFLSYYPYEQGFNFVISEKIFCLFQSFNLPYISAINIKIDGWIEKYYLIGFPMIPDSEIDLEKSLFYNNKEEKEFKYTTYEEYKKVNFDIIAKKIYLKNIFRLISYL